MLDGDAARRLWPRTPAQDASAQDAGWRRWLGLLLPAGSSSLAGDAKNTGRVRNMGTLAGDAGRGHCR